MIISPYHWSRYFHFYTLSETKCNNFLLHALLVMLSVEKYRGENLKRVCKLRHVVFVSFCVLLSCFGIGTVGLYLPLMSTSFVALFICEFVLTHPPPPPPPPWTKWPPVWQTIFSIAFIWMKMYIFRLFVPNGPTDNKTALVQVMAWYRTGD